MKLKLPILKPRQIVTTLLRTGFIKKRQTGSHLILLNPENGKIIPIPMHVKDVKRGLLSAIIKEADLTPEAFLKSLKK